MHSSSAVRMAVGCLVELAFKVASGELKVSVYPRPRPRLGLVLRGGGQGQLCLSLEQGTVPGCLNYRMPESGAGEVLAPGPAREASSGDWEGGTGI